MVFIDFFYKPIIVIWKVRPYISKELCVNCKECIPICPYEVFSTYDENVIVLTPQDCIECTSCVEECPQNAIYMDD